MGAVAVAAHLAGLDERHFRLDRGGDVGRDEPRGTGTDHDQVALERRRPFPLRVNATPLQQRQEAPGEKGEDAEQRKGEQQPRRDDARQGVDNGLTLAVHLGLLSTNAKYGDCPLFPFVMDTPQQSGQDEKNLRKMIEVAGHAASASHQVVLAIETLPADLDISNFTIVQFEKSHGALSKEDFPTVAEVIRGPLTLLNEALASEDSRKQSSWTSTKDS